MPTFPELVTSNNSQSASINVGGVMPPGQFTPGKLNLGFAGHAPAWGSGYQNVPQFITDTKAVYGTVPGTVIVRGLGEGQAAAAIATASQQMLTAGIIPIVFVGTYPAFNTYATEAAAYNGGRSIALPIVQACPAGTVYEIGNEWTIFAPYGGVSGGAPQNPDSWRNNNQWYNRMLGFTAGAVSAIRDTKPDAKIVGGANSGWTSIGLTIAMGVDLISYAPAGGRDLRWDFSCLHWYNDFSGGNHMGDPANYAGGINAYTSMKPIGRPLAVTESGSNGNTTNDGNSITGIYTMFYNHRVVTATEPGVQLVCTYETYATGGELYRLFNSPGVISAAGIVVRDWIAARSNPLV